MADKACEGREVALLLDRLQNPTPADIGAQSRMIRTNQSSQGKRTCRGVLVSGSKGSMSKSESKRVRRESFYCLQPRQVVLFGWPRAAEPKTKYFERSRGFYKASAI